MNKYTITLKNGDIVELECARYKLLGGFFHFGDHNAEPVYVVHQEEVLSIKKG